MLNKRKHLEQCSICFEELLDQAVGIPEGCEHVFCFECISEWAKTNKTCPFDRRNIQFIQKQYSFFNGKPYAKVDVNNIRKELPVEDDSILCQACENDQGEFHPFVRCIRCKDSFHEFCLTTSDLSKWICLSCGHENKENPEFVYQLPVIKREKPSTSNTGERSAISSTEAARRIAASGKSISPSSRETVLANQAKYMTELRQKRKKLARLPPQIPVNQFPRIQRRKDVPIQSQSKVIQKKLTRSSSNVSFIDRLLNSQKQLLSLNNIKLHRAHLNFS